jgi:RimJ/RimL family protein N-acetyltransferase
MPTYQLGDLFTGKLVRLAAPTHEDHTLYAKWSHDAEYGRLVSFMAAKPEPESAFQRRDTYDFTIRTLADDLTIGFCALFEVKPSHKTCMVGIGIGNPDYLGRGYGTDAMDVLLGYAFRELNLHRVSLGVFGYNTRAQRSYEKLGFVREGAERESVYRDDVRYDNIYMGILRRDWEARKAQNAAHQ